jgi:hypothetical protein
MILPDFQIIHTLFVVAFDKPKQSWHVQVSIDLRGLRRKIDTVITCRLLSGGLHANELTCSNLQFTFIIILHQKVFQTPYVASLI